MKPTDEKLATEIEDKEWEDYIKGTWEKEENETESSNKKEAD